jgi:hypothetical protein
MHRFFAATLFLLLAGCANAVRMCGLEAQHEWHQLNRAPSNEADLVSLLINAQEPSDFHHYWFARNDGALLLCRQNPAFATNRCNSDGWLFTNARDTWHVTSMWAEACTG